LPICQNKGLKDSKHFFYVRTSKVDLSPSTAIRVTEAIGEDNVATEPPENLFKMLQFHIQKGEKKKGAHICF
jgi:hypothetical protein